MRILMILIPDPDRLIPPLLQFERFLAPYYLFSGAGADVVLASPLGGDPAMRTAAGDRAGDTTILRRFWQDRSARDALADTLELQQVDPDDFDGAFCLGVTGRIWAPNAASAAGDLIGRLLAAGRPVAALPSALDLDPEGTGAGLLITGDGAEAALLAARALLGALAKP